MARKMMSKEVTKTTVKAAKMEVVDGQAVAVDMPEQVFLGNVSVDYATRLLNKKFNTQVTVISVQPETQTYEMAVEDFIQMATIKQAESK